MSDGKVHCRSGASKDCYDGLSESAIYEDGMADDGTFDGQTVCCDACYIAVGMPSVPINSPDAEHFPQTIEQKE